MKNTNYLQTNMENVKGIFSTLQNTVINIPEIFTSTTISDIEIWDTCIEKVFLYTILQNSLITPLPLFQCCSIGQKKYRQHFTRHYHVTRK